MVENKKDFKVVQRLMGHPIVTLPNFPSLTFGESSIDIIRWTAEFVNAIKDERTELEYEKSLRLYRTAEVAVYPAIDISMKTRPLQRR